MSAEHLTRRQSQGERSRTELLEVAKRLLAERGYAGMSVSRLSSASGLSTSSIYWHFGSKDGVLAAVVEQSLQEFFARRPRAADFDGDPLERLAAMLETYATMLEREPDYLRLLLILLLERHDGSAETRRIISGMRESSLRNFEAALQPVLAPHGEDDRQGLVRDFALMCRALADGTFIASIDQKDVSTPEIYRTLVTLLRAFVVAAEAPDGSESVQRRNRHQTATSRLPGERA